MDSGQSIVKMIIFVVMLILATGSIVIAFDFSQSERTSTEQKIHLPIIFTSSDTAINSPSWSAPIAVSPIDGTLWVVNPDSGTVTIFDPTSMEVLAESAVGSEPWSLAVSSNGQAIYIVDRASGTLSILNRAT